MDRLHEKAENACGAVMLIGTKTDLRSTSRTARSLAECKILAMNYGFKYREVTIEKQETIDSAFEELLDMIMEQNRPPRFEESIKLQQPSAKKESKLKRCFQC